MSYLPRGKKRYFGHCYDEKMLDKNDPLGIDRPEINSIRLIVSEESLIRKPNRGGNTAYAAVLNTYCEKLAVSMRGPNRHVP